MAYSSGVREDVRQAFSPIVRELWRASSGGTTEAVIDINPGAVDQLVEGYLEDQPLYFPGMVWTLMCELLGKKTEKFYVSFRCDLVRGTLAWKAHTEPDIVESWVSPRGCARGSKRYWIP